MRPDTAVLGNTPSPEAEFTSDLGWGAQGRRPGCLGGAFLLPHRTTLKFLGFSQLLPRSRDR